MEGIRGADAGLDGVIQCMRILTEMLCQSRAGGAQDLTVCFGTKATIGRKQCLSVGETQHFWQHMEAERFAFYSYLYSSLKISSDKQLRHLQTTEQALSASCVLGERTAMAEKRAKVFTDQRLNRRDFEIIFNVGTPSFVSLL